MSSATRKVHCREFSYVASHPVETSAMLQVTLQRVQLHKSHPVESSATNKSSCREFTYILNNSTCREFSYVISLPVEFMYVTSHSEGSSARLLVSLKRVLLGFKSYNTSHPVENYKSSCRVRYVTSHPVESSATTNYPVCYKVPYRVFSSV